MKIKTIQANQNMSWRDKGGEGLARGGAKRHRKILRHNIQKITKQAIRRLARRGGVKRVSRISPGRGPMDGSPSKAKASANAQAAIAAGMTEPQSAKEVDFDIRDPTTTPIVPAGTVPVCSQQSYINAQDVLCGRGGGTNTQIGNRRFRSLVQEFQPTYLLRRRRKEKPLIARTIVLIIRKRGGRFLRKDEKDGAFYEVGDDKAEAKTSQALRERLDVRAPPPLRENSQARVFENETKYRKWTEEEHRLFLQGLEKYGTQWDKIADVVKSRTRKQTQNHAQKHFQKLARQKAAEFGLSGYDDIRQQFEQQNMQQIREEQERERQKQMALLQEDYEVRKDIYLFIYPPKLVLITSSRFK